MNNYHWVVSDFFGNDWLNKQWTEYHELISNFNPDSPDSLDTSIIKAEINLHPLVSIFINSQKKGKQIDFSKLNPKYAQHTLITHLGRDLDLLKSEIDKRGNRFRRGLFDPNEYESYRFVLLIAACFKLQNYTVEFIPETNSKTTPDIYVSHPKNGEFFIECKQRNQHIADFARYDLISSFGEDILNTLVTLNTQGIAIEIEITNENVLKDQKLKLELRGEIIRNLWLGRVLFQLSKFYCTVSFRKSSPPSYQSAINHPLNINKRRIYFRAEDAILLVDPPNDNLIVMMKNARIEHIPEKIPELLEDANKKTKDGKKLLVYFDMGRGHIEWANQLSATLLQELKSGVKRYPNIDMLAFCKTMPLILPDGNWIIKPDFRNIGTLTELGFHPADIKLLGTQGGTGMDEYFITDFED